MDREENEGDFELWVAARAHALGKGSMDLTFVDDWREATDFAQIERGDFIRGKFTLMGRHLVPMGLDLIFLDTGEDAYHPFVVRWEGLARLPQFSEADAGPLDGLRIQRWDDPALMETQDTFVAYVAVDARGDVSPGATPEEQNLAVIMNIAVIFFFFVSPLVGFLIAGKEQPFLKEQSRLALNGTITYAIFLAASFVLNVTVVLSVIGVPLLVLAMILNLYGGIKGGVESSHGRFYRYPMSLNLVR